MSNEIDYVCPICGEWSDTTDRFPVCEFCGNEDVIIVSRDEISEIQNDIRKLPEPARRKYLTEDANSDIERMGIMTTEYIRQKYVFNDPRFSKSKFNERERKEEKDYQEFKEQSKRDVAAYYGHPTITCPTCGSTNTKKISGLSKAASVGLFGIFSQKVKHQFHCNSCGYEW
nr:MAG TPA: RNA polymerase I [Caudoviricetes sp.]